MKNLIIQIIFILIFNACTEVTTSPVGEEVKIDSSIPGKISFNPSSINLGEYVIGEESQYNLAIKNSGKLPISAISFLDFDTDSPLSIEENNCENINLAKGESCDITLKFLPDSKGQFSSELVYFYNNGIERRSASLPLSALVGEVARLEINDSSELDFGVHELNETLTRFITVYNAGELTASNITQTHLGDGDFQYVGGSYPGTGATCGNRLKGLASCTLHVLFTASVLKFHTKQFALAYFNADQNDNLNINVQAIADTITAKVRAIGTTSHDFGSTGVGAELTKTITIINYGYLDADNITFPSVSPFTMKSHNCPAVLLVGETCDVTMSFIPTISGLVNGSFQINYNNQVVNTAYTIPVSGTGIPPARFDLIDSGFIVIPNADFGERASGSTNTLSFYLKNIGTLAATSISFGTLSAPFTLETNTCGGQVIAGANCEITIKYSPTSIALHSDILSISFHDGGANTTQNFNILGEGANLAVLENNLVNSTYNFGTKVTGVAYEFTMLLSNPGNIAATNINPIALLAPYSYKGGTFPGVGGTCPGGANFSLASLASCSVVIEYNPTAGLSFVNWGFNYFNGSQNRNILILIQGRGETPSNLSTAGGTLGYRNPNLGAQYLRLEITNSGQTSATLVNYSLQSGANYSFAGGVFPGIHPSLSAMSGNCSATLIGNGSTCNILLEITPSGNGTVGDTLNISYFNGLTTVNSSYPFDIVYDDYAILNYSGHNGPQYTHIFDPTATTASRQLVWTVTNTGGMSANLNAPVLNVNSQFTIHGSSTCGATLNPASSCTYVINYSWPFSGSHLDTLTHEYNDGSPEQKDIDLTLSGTVGPPANLEFTQVDADNNPYDYDLTVVNTSKSNYFGIRNTSIVAATGITLTNLTAPFVVIQNDCPDPIPGNAICYVRVDFTPTAIGTQYTRTLRVNYFNGLSAQFTDRVMKGTGEPPLHTHGGWTEIYAIGDAINLSGVSSVDKKVRLKWEVMIPDASVVGSYSVFRRRSSEDFNFSSPIASNISTTAREFTDTSVDHATTYFYTVRPIISGFPSRSHSSFSEIEVVVPPSNMALAHRIMINKDICEKLGLAVDKNNSNSCVYTGLGSNGSGIYDIGKHILVDRFELGLDNTPRFGQKPKILTQIAANNLCQTFNVTIDGQDSTYEKKLMSRKDFIAVSSWPSNLSHADILTREQGTDSSTYCNGNGANTENTGSNNQCVSRYGIMDLVGNAWEWTSDRVLDGIGVDDTNLVLDTTNTDLNNYDLSALANNSIANFPCFNVPLGLGLPLSGANCDTNMAMATFGAASTHSDYQYAPGNADIKFMLSGGSNLAATTYAGVYTSAWVPYTFGAGFHCSIDILP